MQSADVVIVGAGAAGLMSGIWAGRHHPQRRILLLDGAKKIGAKILVAGGGRCNVTHHQVDASAFAGSSRNAIKKVLRRFDVPQTVRFFKQQGVTLKREPTGKLFPTTNRSKTILNALLTAAHTAQIELRHPQRIETIERQDGQFLVGGAWGTLRAEKVVLATGGRSIPKSGSDGHGYKLAQSLGHPLTKRIFPALVPLTLPKHHFLCQLSGITLPATLTVWAGNGKQQQAFTDSTLLTHFGLSGPSALDISRYYAAAKMTDPQATLTINWLPQFDSAELERQLLALGKKQPLTLLRQYLPDRVVRTLLAQAAIDGVQMTRQQRKQLIALVTRYPLPITGNRGYNYAEVTAGGVPLADINLKTMESRICPNLYFAGEICDVDGRIGGFNFQWAWASGYVAGVSV